MIWTNRAELPAPLFRALTEKSYIKVGDVSVTELIKSPQQRLLAMRHDSEIVKDASENLWSVAGTAFHDLMVKFSGQVNGLSEERFTVKVKGPFKTWELSGQVDLIEDLGKGLLALTDYKFVGTFSYLAEKKRGGVKEEWEQQLNMYRWLIWKALGWDVKLLRIGFVGRDWMKSKAEAEQDYPKQPILILDANVWPLEQIEAFINERIALHQTAEEMEDETLPACTPKETWERGEKWAVMKGTNKRAEKLCDSEVEANEFLKDVAGGRVTFRPGKPTKCLSYCDGAPWCSQLAAYKKANGIESPIAA